MEGPKIAGACFFLFFPFSDARARAICIPYLMYDHALYDFASILPSIRFSSSFSSPSSLRGGPKGRRRRCSFYLHVFAWISWIDL